MCVVSLNGCRVRQSRLRIIGCVSMCPGFTCARFALISRVWVRVEYRKRQRERERESEREREGYCNPYKLIRIKFESLAMWLGDLWTRTTPSCSIRLNSLRHLTLSPTPLRSLWDWKSNFWSPRLLFHSEASNSFIGPSTSEIYCFLITFNENVEATWY